MRFGEVDVPAVKVRGAWYVDATALAVAIEHARHSGNSAANGRSAEEGSGESEEYTGMMRFTFLSVERLISGVPAYLDVVGEIARGPFAFARKLDWTDPEELDRATNYLIFSVIVTLFLAIGASLLAKVIYGDSGHGIPKLQYMVDTLVPFALFGAIIHSALWLLGVRRPGSFKTTMTVYAYHFGTTQPLTYLLLFPVVVPIGPELMLGGAESSPRTLQVFASAPGLAIYAVLALLIVAGLGMTLLVSWLASAHHVSKKRVALALAMALLPFSALYTVVQVVLDFLAPGLEWLDAVL